jgi:hypothetical protein
MRVQRLPPVRNFYDSQSNLKIIQHTLSQLIDVIATENLND